MISEGSCGTEDWSSGYLKFSFAIRDKLHFKLYSNIKVMKNALVNMKHLQKSYQPQTFEW